MGYFSNLAIDIEEALFQGATVEQIAERFNLSVPAVNAYIEQLEQADREFYAPDRKDMAAWTDHRLRDFESGFKSQTHNIARAYLEEVAQEWQRRQRKQDV